jgi:hypothetical protein
MMPKISMVIRSLIETFSQSRITTENLFVNPIRFRERGKHEKIHSEFHSSEGERRLDIDILVNQLSESATLSHQSHEDHPWLHSFLNHSGLSFLKRPGVDGNQYLTTRGTLVSRQAIPITERCTVIQFQQSLDHFLTDLTRTIGCTWVQN